MNLTVGIPTYNGKEKIRNVLKALENQNVQDFETIVNIDGSTDGTEEIVAPHQSTLRNLVIIKSENGGRAKARNVIARQAKGELLLFFDDDMRPTEHCVKMHIEHHATQENTILVGNHIEDESKCKTDIQRYKLFLSNKWNRANKEKLNYPFIAAAHFSISKKLFFELNAFDERFTDAEDYDLAIRAFEQGIDIFFDPTIIAWHDDFITLKNYITRQREYSQAQNKLAQINPSVKKYSRRVFKNKKGVKGFILYILSLNFIYHSIQNEYFWIMLLPLSIRYKLYDLVITSWAKCYPDKKLS